MRYSKTLPACHPYTSSLQSFQNSQSVQHCRNILQEITPLTFTAVRSSICKCFVEEILLHITNAITFNKFPLIYPSVKFCFSPPHLLLPDIASHVFTELGQDNNWAGKWVGMRLSHYKNLGKLFSQNNAVRKAKKKIVAATSLELFKAGGVDGVWSNVV